MTRLLIHVEGETEETFVNEILGPHLYACGYTAVSARLIGNPRQRDRRGGIKPWSTVRRDILNHLKEDTSCLVSTMVDYYGLPKSSSGAWPGRETADNVPFSEKANTVENALLTDICEQMGSAFNRNRFIPYLMMHEFEALLFSDCEAFSRSIGHPSIAREFQEIRDTFDSPEEIDDSPHTAPSKRVERLVPEYQKPLFGTLAALDIGLDKIRAECPHFRDWLARLERAGQA
ncbi:MAG: DUF4276 family protein [Gemmatimonadetes bacterium]|nr:DUF4276 family protein [Gemmatimonadota bacterium]MYF16915.1 DUF4276 family protein [Gemmatimonadota bacterium]